MQKATPDLVKLTTLANQMLDRALEEDATLDQQIDIAKTVTSLYVALNRISAKMDADAPSGGMTAMREAIKAAGGVNGADAVDGGGGGAGS